MLHNKSTNIILEWMQENRFHYLQFALLHFKKYHGNCVFSTEKIPTSGENWELFEKNIYRNLINLIYLRLFIITIEDSKIPTHFAFIKAINQSSLLQKFNTIKFSSNIKSVIFSIHNLKLWKSDIIYGTGYSAHGRRAFRGMIE